MKTETGALILAFAIAALLFPVECGRTRTAIKINDGSSGFSYTPPSYTHHEAAPPTPFRPPMPVSGPPLMIPTARHCYEYSDVQYRYELCPFRNVTQRSRSMTPGSLYVIMGVWREYEVAEGRYAAMKFDDGSMCGNGQRRQTRVVLECGQSPTVSRVTEPQPCVYEMYFTIPQACGAGLTLMPPPADGLVEAVIEGEYEDDGEDSPPRVVMVPRSEEGAEEREQRQPAASKGEQQEEEEEEEGVNPLQAVVDGQRACIRVLALAVADSTTVVDRSALAPCVPFLGGDEGGGAAGSRGGNES